jgi:hypothetical protein
VQGIFDPRFALAKLVLPEATPRTCRAAPQECRFEIEKRMKWFVVAQRIVRQQPAETAMMTAFLNLHFQLRKIAGPLRPNG